MNGVQAERAHASRELSNEAPGGVLRFSTAGSVDDGKSTLIGRLLYDTKALFSDQIEAVQRASSRRGYDGLDLALLTDGLTAEREQGITIDVAYRYFSTPKRKFIIADTPGHEQYTRNMVTGSSTADLTVILIDARNGLVRQSRRHACIASLLRIPHVVVAINKMDLVDWSEAVFRRIESEFREFASRLELGEVHFVPMSALLGDMVVDRGEHLSWYRGPALLELLEKVDVDRDEAPSGLRFPVQLVSRVQGHALHDAQRVHLVDQDDGTRAYLGRVEAGSVSIGDAVTVLPSGHTSRVRSIRLWPEARNVARRGDSVSVELEDDIDISRGAMIVHTDAEPPRVTRELDAVLCWMDGDKLDPARKYVVKHTTNSVRAILSRPEYRLDVESLEHVPAETLAMNDIGRVRVRLQQPIACDPYRLHRDTGAFVVIDEFSRNTVAAGIVLDEGGAP
jgi:sulfate adenylyltransferase subunit 1